MPASKSPSPIGYTKACRALRAHADPARAQVYRRYFKDPGADVFLGVSTKEMRLGARDFRQLPMPDVRRLMCSRVHEERSLAHAILRWKFEKRKRMDLISAFLVALILVPSSPWIMTIAAAEQGRSGQNSYAKKAMDADTGRVYSPDRRKWVTARRVWVPNTDEEVQMRISVHLGSKRFTTELNGFGAEILWAPDSSAFAVNETEGGGGIGQRTYVFYVSSGGLRKLDVSMPVEKSFGQPVKCEIPVPPNTAILTWLTPNRVLVGAEVINVSLCQHMGTFMAYEVSLSDLKILNALTQSETKARFGEYLGCELHSADDRSAAGWQHEKAK
jgi:hypothetical protein